MLIYLEKVPGATGNLNIQKGRPFRFVGKRLHACQAKKQPFKRPAISNTKQSNLKINLLKYALKITFYHLCFENRRENGFSGGESLA